MSEQPAADELDSIRKRVQASIADPRPSLSGEEVRKGLQERFERALKTDAEERPGPL